MALDVNVVDAERIRVCLTEDQIEVCCYVSSFHLVDEKEPQSGRDQTKSCQAYSPHPDRNLGGWG